MQSAQDPELSFAPQPRPPESCLGALPAPTAAKPPQSVLNFEHSPSILAGHFSWEKSNCAFPINDGEQHMLSPIYYTVSPSSCSLVTELQVSKMISITESPVVCAALDISLMSRHYDLGEACFA